MNPEFDAQKRITILTLVVIIVACLTIVPFVWIHCRNVTSSKAVQPEPEVTEAVESVEEDAVTTLHLPTCPTPIPGTTIEIPVEPTLPPCPTPIPEATEAPTDEELRPSEPAETEREGTGEAEEKEDSVPMQENTTDYEPEDESIIFVSEEEQESTESYGTLTSVTYVYEEPEVEEGVLYTDVTYYGLLSFPDYDYSVHLYAYDGTVPSTTIVDRNDSACFFNFAGTQLIADHVNQGFSIIKGFQAGDICTIERYGETYYYECIEVDPNGTNDSHSITMGDGRNAEYIGDGTIAMYTCNDVWTSVTVAVFKEM